MTQRRLPSAANPKQDRNEEEADGKNTQTIEKSSAPLLCTETKISQEKELTNTSGSRKPIPDPIKISQKPQDQRRGHHVDGKYSIFFQEAGISYL